jgi:hypothetical protein
LEVGLLFEIVRLNREDVLKRQAAAARGIDPLAFLLDLELTFQASGVESRPIEEAAEAPDVHPPFW